MLRISVFFRTVWLMFLFCLPLTLIGGALGDLPGLAVGSVLALGFLIFIWMTAEDNFIYSLDGEAVSSDGLQKTCNKAIETVDPYLKHLPRFFYFPEPRSEVTWVRSLGGNGAIFISSGLLSTKSENEIIDSVVSAYRKILEPGAKLSSLSAALHLWLVRIMPQPEKQISVRKMILLWAALPVVSMLAGRTSKTYLRRRFRLPGDIAL